jgi:hypothetical protein
MLYFFYRKQMNCRADWCLIHIIFVILLLFNKIIDEPSNYKSTKRFQIKNLNKNMCRVSGRKFSMFIFIHSQIVSPHKKKHSYYLNIALFKLIGIRAILPRWMYMESKRIKSKRATYLIIFEPTLQCIISQFLIYLKVSF